jgi:predicted site-specific integrase-resolvase
MSQELSLPVVAARLGMSWHVVYRLALSGKLGPLTRANNRWILTAAGIEAYEQRESDAAETRR